MTKVNLCNAGLPYPVIFRRAQNSLEMLKTHGTIIGVLEDSFFEERSVYLNPGDCLMMFTDGIYTVYPDHYRDALGNIYFRYPVQKYIQRSSSANQSSWLQ
jgi:serine phosphatase RsbU (regulator of sigma subunit)